MAGEFVEMVVKGPYDRVKAFVSGFLAGKGVTRPRLWYSRDCGIRQEKLPEKIVEWAGLVKDRVHLVVEQPLVVPLRAALRKHGPEFGFEPVSELRIAGAALPFRFRCYQPEQGKKLAERFRRLPPGLSLRKGYKLEEEVHPDAEGVELYAPQHGYTLRGSGVVEGPVDRVLRFRETLQEFEMLELRPVELVRA